MNTDKLVIFDKAYVVPCKESKSEIFMSKENNLIESNSKIQSDNFSYKKELIQSQKPKEILIQNKISFNQSADVNKANNLTLQYNYSIEVNDTNGFKEQIDDYKIIYPKNNSVINVGDDVYFECALVTDNPLSPENFDNLIWVSSLDGLIGVNNKFNSMLSFGEHVISLIYPDYLEGKDNEKIKVDVIKDEIKIIVNHKQTYSTEIKQ